MKSKITILALMLVLLPGINNVHAEEKICPTCGHECNEECEYDVDGLCIHECGNDPLPIDENWPRV